jgi:hypothetical protein
MLGRHVGNSYASASAYVDCVAKAIVKIYAYASAFAYAESDCSGKKKDSDAFAFIDAYVSADFTKKVKCWSSIDASAVGNAWAAAKAKGKGKTVCLLCLHAAVCAHAFAMGCLHETLMCSLMCWCWSVAGFVGVLQSHQVACGLCRQ